jgi:4-amino-4-deoxy-L-arabinose transferase-like glycosyltransferase
VAAREERMLAADEAGWRPYASAARSSPWPALALALAAAAVLAIRLDVPGFFDNEGRYAEVAREMVLSGDWVSPHLDFTLFLNKPPLTFWLTAAVFRLGGPAEWARLASIVAAAVTLFAICRLGAILWGQRAGLTAGFVLATMLGFVLEARTLRPDVMVMAAVAAALLCWRRAEAPGAARTRWLAAMYAVLGLGVLAKGLVPLAVVGVPIGLVTLRERGWRGIAALRPGLGLVVLAAIVLPWHVLVSLRHPGFAWDYVVNQHLLFLLDKKLPRDSEGDTLAFFWMAFLGLGLPWSLVLPLALGEAARGAARAAGAAARGSFLAGAWAGGLLLVFSCVPSRLHHYSVPALPAVALVARVGERARAGELGAAAWAYLAVTCAAVALGGGVGLLRGRALVERAYWILQAPDVFALVAPAGVTVLAVGVLGLLAARRRRPALLGGVLALAVVPVTVIVLTAMARVEPLFSWRPLAHALVRAVPPEAGIVFEAPVEYQLVGGLAFYTRRRITLLEVPGFVPPTYLQRAAATMFLPRAEFARRWQAGERLAFVSDPQQRREDPAGLVPGPFHVLGRFGDRWVLTSFPVAG